MMHDISIGLYSAKPRTTAEVFRKYDRPNSIITIHGGACTCMPSHCHMRKVVTGHAWGVRVLYVPEFGSQSH